MASTTSSEDRAPGARLQAGLLKKFGELQQGLARTAWIDAEGQARDAFLVDHPEWNGESPQGELDFDMLTAVEVMRPKNLQFLPILRVEWIVHRNSARIASIIPAGLETRPTRHSPTRLPGCCGPLPGGIIRGAAGRFDGCGASPCQDYG